MSNSMRETRKHILERLAFQPKMWSTPQNTDRCPLRLFEQYLKDYCEVDSPLYLAINYDAKLGGCWYKRQGLGVNRLGNIMKIMANRAGLQGNKTNHTARKTCVTTLTSPKTQIIQLTGHRNVQSLISYKQPSLLQQEEMSRILSSHLSGQQPEKSVVHNSALQCHTTLPANNASRFIPDQWDQGLFQGAHFSGCTFNINFPTSMQTLSTTDCTNITYNSQLQEP